MKKTEAFTTSDGKIFTDESQATQYEREQAAMKWITDNLAPRDGMVTVQNIQNSILKSLSSLIEALEACGLSDQE